MGTGRALLAGLLLAVSACGASEDDVPSAEPADPEQLMDVFCTTALLNTGSANEDIWNLLEDTAERVARTDHPDGAAVLAWTRWALGIGDNPMPTRWRTRIDERCDLDGALPVMVVRRTDG